MITWEVVNMRWRNIRPGDVIVNGRAEMWMVTSWSLVPNQATLTVVRGAGTHTFQKDPDEAVRVLLASTEREAILLAREQLGAVVTDREV
jgi:hypothetical protein